MSNESFIDEFILDSNKFAYKKISFLFVEGEQENLGFLMWKIFNDFKCFVSVRI